MSRFLHKGKEEPGPAEAEPSERLLEQRVRNQIMDELLSLSGGNWEISEQGTEWFEGFFDLYPYEGEPSLFPAMTVEEEMAVREVCGLMQQAIVEIGLHRFSTFDDMTKSGWPERIAPVA